MDHIIELQNVTKVYKSKSILEEVNLSIPSNQVTAVVGKNGSGKSTLLKLIGGLMKPDSGQILFPKGKTLRIGYVPELTPAVIPFTPVEYLTHMGMIRSLPKKQVEQRINTLLKMFHMEDDRNIRIIHFSKGMKQKITIMQAMLEETDLLIMDEPLSGLDPKAQRDLEELLISLKRRKISVILSCHETRLLERVVDQIFVINQCKITQKSGQHASGKLKNRLVIELLNPALLASFRDKVTIESERKIDTDLSLIELTVNHEQTDQMIREFLEIGASIKLLTPLNELENEFSLQFERKRRNLQ